MTATSDTSQSAKRPSERVNPIQWVRKNLFHTRFNSVLTLIILPFLLWVVWGLVTWVLFTADWVSVATNLRLLMVGTYPASEIWRVWTSVALACTLIGLSWGIWPAIMGNVGPAYGIGLLVLLALPLELPNRLWLVLCSGLIFGGWLLARRLMQTAAAARVTRWVAFSWPLLLVLVIVLLWGVDPILPVTDTNDWGGLMLTFVLAITGIVFSFPIGVLVAIGRRSELPVVRIFCTMYIEGFRGVPLVTVLFMFLIMMPLFVPGGENVDNIIRAIVGFTLFTSAYIAENVRGGLQAIPNGQLEASRALGLNPMLTMIFIVLPQALRIVIPANVNQFVSLFKDTSLVIVAGGGLLELLSRARNIADQPEFLGQWLEPLVFAAFIYWIFCYSMTYVSRRLEAELGVGYR